MPSLPDGEAEIYDCAKEAILDVWASALQDVPTVERMQRLGIEQAQLPNGGYYSRTSVICPEELQGRVGIGLINDSTAVRYRYLGHLHIQVFGAKSEAAGYDTAKAIANALKLKFIERRTVVGGIVFRDVRVKPEATEGQWYHHRMVAEWEFDEILRKATA